MFIAASLLNYFSFATPVLHDNVPTACLICVTAVQQAKPSHDSPLVFTFTWSTKFLHSVLLSIKKLTLIAFIPFIPKV